MYREPPFRRLETMPAATRAAMRREGLAGELQVQPLLLQVLQHLHRARAALARQRPPPAARSSGGWLRRGE